MTNKDLNLANSALRLVVAYDDLMRRYTGPVSDLTGADNAAIDEAYDQMVAAARITLDVTARTTPPAPQEHVVASGDTIMKADVEKMIRDWQAECVDHPALHNQGNVLLDRLKALKPSLAMEDFLTGMDRLAEQAQASMTFSSDDDALEFLKLYGHKESQNGVIRGDWRCFDADCRAAVNYLCDEWDFVFEDTNTPSPQPNVAPDAAARLERILQLGRSMKWTVDGAPALQDEDTAVAVGELFHIFFQDAVDRALTTKEQGQ